MDTQPITLEGTYVRLEPLTPSHLDGLMRAGADEAIWRWMPYCPRTRDEFAKWLDDAIRATERGDQLGFATIDRASGEIVGSTRLFFVSPHDRRVEIGGTWLAPHAQRTGINTEAKLMMMTYCFETLGCVRVELKTDSRNEQSRRAIARIGGQFEGIMRKHMLVQGGNRRDSAYFAVIDDDWPAVKQRLTATLATATAATRP
jgi:RimJ/RimL family protein N-acetyltransferase